MALAEKTIKEVATKSPERYATRVRITTLAYLLLNVVSLVIIVTIVWRIQYFVTLAQRSNVETLVIAIVFVLALYYVATTFRGFLGGLRMFLLNVSPESREERKQRAMKTGGKSKYVCLDQAVCLEGKHNEVVRWDVADDVGKLGELVLDGAKITYYPTKHGMNGSIFEFLLDQLEKVIQRRDPGADLQITQWSRIDEDEASSYSSMVQAFRNLEQQLGNGSPIWPTLEITERDVEEIGKELRRLVPTLRNESFLPDVEYAVEYSVPILPEPLGFMRLTRNENRADPLITMGCASLIMLALLLILTVMILLPPWVPSK